MKYSEFHRLIKKNGWEFHHAEGSHYFYIKKRPPLRTHSFPRCEGDSGTVKEKDL